MALDVKAETPGALGVTGDVPTTSVKDAVLNAEAGYLLAGYSTGGAATATLGSLTDVALATPSNGQFLAYNGTQWYNTNITLALSALSDVNVTEGSGINGKFLKWDNGTSRWVASTVPATLAGQSDVLITSPANNDVLTYNSGASKWENIAPAAAASLEVYYAGANTKFTRTGSFVDHVIETIDSCVATVAGSASSRVFSVNAGVAWDSSGETLSQGGSGGSGHQMRVCLLLDGVQVWPYLNDTLAGIGTTSGGEMMTWATISSAIVTVPGDGASHTIALAWSASTSLGGFSYYGRGVTAIKVA